ncbi:hypothetical protein COL26_22900 [Bacillus thuringiensis]|uniref:Crystal protein n=1 Tax=Bacillus thuringiensis TaxID=1428 RepID=A0ABD6RXK7_BACTU|nr:hypothetical protein [Bacillus thuringiensis]PER46166.1 hypothetical protein CN495_26475 [Bacillus thuringiensis]PEU89528.1 hypothetical protein CN411_10425 [Bacillus thuringiensis]PFI05726.1 hypothetical protein COI79_24955 [Bacillus thuringiensis]PFW33989.1 hypothetical protein COL26_22900 [Bacillus thuringiensis]PGY69566.1 hypothetical protein COE44_26035 [Bacillus thuringiensis]
MNANVTDLIELFGRYANQWSQQQGGGNSKLSFMLPGFEHLAFTSFTKPVKYNEPTINMPEDVAVDSHTYTNKGNKKLDVTIELMGTLKNWLHLQVNEGTSEAGKRFLNIDLPNDIPSFLNEQLVPIGGALHESSHMQSWEVNHPFTINPKFKVTATLMIKTKKVTRLFEMQRILSRYIAIHTSQAINGHLISLHHVSRILKDYLSPYIQVDGNKVTVTDKGKLQSLFGIEQYIRIQGKSLSNPNIKEDYNIYNPETSVKQSFKLS